MQEQYFVEDVRELEYVRECNWLSSMASVTSDSLSFVFQRLIYCLS